MSKLLQAHRETSSALLPAISDLHYSPAWTAQYSANGPFHGDPRALSLGFCVDGLNPFSKEKVSYSMWPITMTMLNLPHHVRNLAGSMLLVGIIPGKL